MCLSEVEINTRHYISDVIRDMSDAILNNSPHSAFRGSFLAWNIFRSKKLSRVLQAELSVLIDLISKLQSADGSWSLPQWMHGSQDSTCEVTALCLLALARNHDKSRYDEHIDRASAWLCSAQRHDGSWTSSGGRHSAAEPDLLTTAFAREALAISTQNFGKNIERAASYIIEAQQPLGNWTNQHFPIEFITAVFVDCLTAEWADVLPRFANEHLRMARELLPRGKRLLTGG